MLTALVVLRDTKAGDTERQVGFNSGLKTTKGDVAIIITPSRTEAIDLATGQSIATGQSAYNPSGYDNVIEADPNKRPETAEAVLVQIRRCQAEHARE